jgi:hypothetical protein
MRTTDDPKTRRLTMRLSPKDAARLDALAEKGGCSPPETMRRLLRGQPVAAAHTEQPKPRRERGTELDARRGDIFYIDYQDPKVIVETTMPPDKNRPVTREMVESIKLRGQEVPAEGYKLPGLRDGKQVVVLKKGLRRWHAINMAWEELLAEGTSEDMLPPFRLIVKRYVNDMDAFEAGIIENYHRENESDESKARKLQQYLGRGRDSERVQRRALVIFNLKSREEMDALLKLVPAEG